MRGKSAILPISALLLSFMMVALGSTEIGVPWLGKQSDGSFLVSSGQRVEGDSLAFEGRPSDIALHPSGEFVAVLSQYEVFLCSKTGILARTHAALGGATGAGFRGIVWTGDHRGAYWTPDGMRFMVSTDQGYLQEFLYEDHVVTPTVRVSLVPKGVKRNAVPGGMCMTHDGKTLFVAATNLDAVVEVDIATHKRVRAFPVQALPYEVRLSQDEKTLIVSDWGGRKPLPGDETAKSADEDIVVDKRGIPSTGLVSLINRATGETTHLPVGIHPSAIAVSGEKAYVTNALSDSISELDVPARKVTRTLPIRWGNLRVVGAMPNALAVHGDTLYVCDGGDNAVCEIDIPSGSVRGFRHAGFYPSAIELSHDGKMAWVLNTKGNGSVANTIHGNAGNPHDFQGTLTMMDLTRDLHAETEMVARDNRWNRDPAEDKPSLAVYNGAIKHVLYIIKENQTYDSIFGDMPEGNGDPKLCVMGEKTMPNHRALARQFTLFDNGYVSGTNSADGHAWCTQSIANDYMEHFYVGYSRTYADDGDCAMSLSTGGCLWDRAAQKHKSIRVYGEFCDDELSRFSPYKPRDWFEAWEDYKSGKHKFKYTTGTRVAGLRPYICPNMHYWPLIESDQQRADTFIEEYRQYSKTDTVPDLEILTLTNDHGEGLNPKFPTIRAMQADNDLAYGRVVEAVSHSPQWKDTIIFMIEDDGQAEPDHVDGHRTAYMVISPYTRRHYVDSTLYTTTNMLRSIELILGLEPMTRFDALSKPITTCFTDTPDLTPYTHVPNNIPLDQREPPVSQMSATDLYWYHKTLSLDWSHLDGPDAYWLSRIHWYRLTDGKIPFPNTPGQAIAQNNEVDPGVEAADHTVRQSRGTR